jgi:hypothetical protein
MWRTWTADVVLQQARTATRSRLAADLLMSSMRTWGLCTRRDHLLVMGLPDGLLFARVVRSLSKVEGH